MQMAVRAQETHAVLSYSSFAADAGNGGGIGTLDVSDPNGNALTLLRNVEHVYSQSMTHEDEKNKLTREKVHMEDQIRRLTQEKEQLAHQLAQEKSRRTTDATLSQELAKNEVLMKSIVTQQQTVKSTHDADFAMVKELVHHSSAHRTVLKTLSREVTWLRAKQASSLSRV